MTQLDGQNTRLGASTENTMCAGRDTACSRLVRDRVLPESSCCEADDSRLVTPRLLP